MSKIFELKKMNKLEAAEIIKELIWIKGYTSSDITYISDFTTALEVNDFKRLLNINNVKLNNNYQVIKYHLNKFHQLSKQELLYIKESILLARITKLEFAKKYDVPYSIVTIITNELFKDKQLWKKSSAARASQSQKSNFYTNISYNIKNIEELHCFSYLLHNNKNYQNSYISKFFKSNIMEMYETFFDYNGYPDVYPDGIISTFINPKINKQTLLNLANAGLIIIQDKLYNSSKIERKIEGELKKLNINYIKNDRTQLLNTKCHGQEIDFYLTDIQVGIEINPSYTHNSNYFNINKFNSSKPNDYHYNKYLAAKEKGITLIQLYDYDLYIDNFETITIPKLKSRIGKNINHINKNDIYISKLYDKSIIDDFILNNNINVTLYGDNIYFIKNRITDEILGLFEIKYKNNDSHELTNVIIKTENHITKIIKSIIDYLKLSTNISNLAIYSNNDWYDGKSLEDAGFTFIKETGPIPIFISQSNAHDIYTINNIPINNFNNPISRKYIELNMPHQLDNKTGYHVVYTSGYKKWQIKH